MNSNRPPITHAFSLRIGSCVVDLLDPQPEQMDLEAIWDNLTRTFRFTCAEGALAVSQHRLLVEDLARRAAEPPVIVRWAKHHDDHEGIIGDITGPIKALIKTRTNVLDAVEERLDWALCMKMGIPVPTEEERRIVHFYDKLAETLEWRYILLRDPEPWNREFPDWLCPEEAESFALRAIGYP